MLFDFGLAFKRNGDSLTGTVVMQVGETFFFQQGQDDFKELADA